MPFLRVFIGLSVASDRPASSSRPSILDDLVSCSRRRMCKDTSRRVSMIDLPSPTPFGDEESIMTALYRHCLNCEKLGASFSAAKQKGLFYLIYSIELLHALFQVSTFQPFHEISRTFGRSWRAFDLRFLRNCTKQSIFSTIGRFRLGRFPCRRQRNGREVLSLFLHLPGKRLRMSLCQHVQKLLNLVHLDELFEHAIRTIRIIRSQKELSSLWMISNSLAVIKSHFLVL